MLGDLVSGIVRLVRAGRRRDQQGPADRGAVARAGCDAAAVAVEQPGWAPTTPPAQLCPSSKGCRSRRSSSDPPHDVDPLLAARRLCSRAEISDGPLAAVLPAAARTRRRSARSRARRFAWRASYLLPRAFRRRRPRPPRRARRSTAFQTACRRRRRRTRSRRHRRTAGRTPPLPALPVLPPAPVGGAARPADVGAAGPGDIAAAGPVMSLPPVRDIAAAAAVTEPPLPVMVTLARSRCRRSRSRPYPRRRRRWTRRRRRDRRAAARPATAPGRVGSRLELQVVEAHRAAGDDVQRVNARGRRQRARLRGPRASRPPGRCDRRAGLRVGPGDVKVVGPLCAFTAQLNGAHAASR